MTVVESGSSRKSCDSNLKPFDSSLKSLDSSLNSCCFSLLSVSVFLYVFLFLRFRCTDWVGPCGNTSKDFREGGGRGRIWV